MVWKWLKLIGLLAGVLAIAAVVQARGIRWTELTPGDVRDYVLSFGWWAPVLFALAYAQPIVPLPFSVMAMAAGLAFGLLGGMVLLIAAGVVRACGQFLLARYCGRPAVETVLKGRLWNVDAGIGRHGFAAVLWVRLVPNAPFDMQNFTLGLSKISFSAFSLATLIGLIPTVAFWVWLGHSVRSFSQLFLVIGALLALSSLSYAGYRWWKARRVPATRERSHL